MLCMVEIPSWVTSRMNICEAAIFLCAFRQSSLAMGNDILHAFFGVYTINIYIYIYVYISFTCAHDPSNYNIIHGCTNVTFAIAWLGCRKALCGSISGFTR